MGRTARILTLVMCVALCATTARAIDTAAFLLVNSIHARAISMGSTGVADNSDPSTIFFNPANVCAGSRVYGTAAEQRFDHFPDLWLRSANAGFSYQPKGRSWTVGVDAGYAKLNFGDFSVYDFNDSLIATVKAYQDVASLTAGIGFSGSMYEFRFGAGVKMWRSHDVGGDYINPEPVIKADATTFNAGFAVAMHERYGAWNITPAIGAAMMDMGENIQWPNGDRSKLPTRLNFGASVRIESSPCEVLSARVPLVTVICQAEGIAPTDGDFEWGIGNEIAVAQILFVRAGVHRYALDLGGNYLGLSNPTTASWGVGLGLPAGSLRARFDYGREPPPSGLGDINFDKDYMDVLVEWMF